MDGTGVDKNLAAVDAIWFVAPAPPEREDHCPPGVEGPFLGFSSGILNTGFICASTHLYRCPSAHSIRAMLCRHQNCQRRLLLQQSIKLWAFVRPEKL